MVELRTTKLGLLCKGVSLNVSGWCLTKLMVMITTIIICMEIISRKDRSRGGIKTKEDTINPTIRIMVKGIKAIIHKNNQVVAKHYVLAVA